MQIVSKVCWYNNLKKKAAAMNKFTFLCLSCVVNILKLILFYNRVVYFYTRIFLILHPRTICNPTLIGN